MLNAYVGCYTTPDRHGRGEGISVYRVDEDTHAWNLIQEVKGEQNPTFLAVEPRGHFLYAVHGGTMNQVSAFEINPVSGELTLLNRQPSHSDNPVFPAVHPSSRWLAIANYTGGSIVVYPLLGDGRIGQATDIHQHTGPLGPNPERQERPHPHQITWDPPGRYLFVPDLGQDRTYCYQLSPDGKFVANEPPFASSPPGSGPRHIAFHPGERWAYLIHEMGNLTVTFAQADERSDLQLFQTLSTLPDDFRGESTAAEVAVAPGGMCTARIADTTASWSTRWIP